jgi:putative flippase GtrA
MNSSKITGTIFLKDKRARYLIVGGTAFLLEYFLFLAINYATHLLVIANIISFLVGFIFSFLFHLKWTFTGKHRFKLHQQFVSYGLLAGINLVLSSLVITFFVQALYIPPFAAKVISMVLVITWNFIILNRIIFKTHEGLGD